MRAGAVLSAAVALALGAAPVAAARWSAPERLSGCAAARSAQAPAIVFPSSEPHSRSGPGALLWDAPRACAASPGGAGGAGGPGGTAAPQALAGSAAGKAFGATLSADDLPGRGRPLAEGGGALAGILAATGTAAGQVVVAGSAPDASAGAAAGGSTVGALTEGRMVGAFAPARPLGGPAAPVAASSSYLGDAVLASPVRTRGAGWAIAVRVQRHYSSAFARVRLLPLGPAPVSAVAAAMDYRADILLAWVAGGKVYAREIPATGRIGPVQRLGSAGSEPEIGALISDDGHAIVAWRSQSAAPGFEARPPRTTIELSLCEEGSTAAPSSCPARTVERFRDPTRFPLPPGSLRLIRLSSEAVMMAWTGVSAGRYVVRASPVSLRRGAWAPVTISTPGTNSGPEAAPASGMPPASAAAAARGEDAVLADLVPGPDAEALALWTTAPRLPAGGSNPRRWAIVAAKGHYAGRGEAAFEAPESVAPPGLNGTPAVAFDPQSGQALAAWVAGGRIAYAVRAAGPASALAPAGARAATGGSSTTLALLALALLLLAVAAALVFRVARRPGHMRAHRG